KTNFFRIYRKFCKLKTTLFRIFSNSKCKNRKSKTLQIRNFAKLFSPSAPKNLSNQMKSKLRNKKVQKNCRKNSKSSSAPKVKRRNLRIPNPAPLQAPMNSSKVRLCQSQFRIRIKDWPPKWELI